MKKTNYIAIASMMALIMTVSLSPLAFAREAESGDDRRGSGRSSQQIHSELDDDLGEVHRSFGHIELNDDHGINRGPSDDGEIRLFDDNNNNRRGHLLRGDADRIEVSHEGLLELREDRNDRAVAAGDISNVMAELLKTIERLIEQIKQGMSR